MKLAWSLSVAVILTLACGIATAQSQNESLGDYARAVRKTKPESGTDASKVYDNDNLPAAGTVSIVGSQSTAQSSDTADQNQTADKTQDAGADKADTNADAADQDKKNKKDEAQLKPGQSDEDRDKALDAVKARLAAQRDKISLLTRELDVLKGEYNLKTAQFYSDAAKRVQNPSAMMNDDAKYKQQIADKQKALDDANAELTNMEDTARRHGAPDSALE